MLKLPRWAIIFYVTREGDVAGREHEDVMEAGKA